jgi:NADH oxidoreductase Hcr
MSTLATQKYILKEKINEATDVVTFRFSPTEGTIPAFIPGQFVNVYFIDDRHSGQGKAYSISSTPQDPFLDITVKKIGRFSGALHDLIVGEAVSMSEPQGYFYPTDNMHDIVYLAGGIGVTPFYSIIKNDLLQNSARKSVLFYSNRTQSDVAFAKELSELENKTDTLKVIHVLTRQQSPTSEHIESSRINVAMIKKHLGALENRYYFICGSISFVRDLWKELKANGVAEENIKVESFY